MPRSWKCVLWLVTGWGLVGCGGAETAQPEAKTTEQAAAAKQSADKPELTVVEFLEAVRVGNDSQAAFLLTPLARQKTKEMNLAVAAPVLSKTAKFAVGQIEMVGEDGAHVSSTWSDVNESGEREADEIVWMLRHETEGWRIAGMATKLFEDAPPLYLNFEDPEDMLRKQQLAAQEIARRMKADAPPVEAVPDATAERPAAAKAEQRTTPAPTKRR